MDAKFQSSFIPKQPITDNGRVSSEHISILYLISLIIFIITLGAGVASYFGKIYFEKNLQELNNNLVQAQNSFELSTISDLQRASAKIETAKYLLDKHFSFSRFFDFLSKVTYVNVTLSNFSYTLANGVPTVSMHGQASSFNSIILQADLFQKTKQFTNTVVSGFALDADGNVSFNMTASVDPSLVLYKNYVSSNENN